MIDCGRFVRSDVGGISWFISEGYQEESLFAAGFQWSRGRLIRTTPRRRVLQVEGRHGSFLVKHFVVVGIWQRLKELLRGSPAAREWKALQEAQRRGLPVPRLVASGKSRTISQRQGFLVTDFVEGSIPLGEYLFGRDRPTGSARRRVVAEVAKLVVAAHDAGLYQPDLHAGNILVRPSGQGLELFLIDLQRARFAVSLSLRKRWRNLAALHGGCVDASLADRVGFLRSYLSISPVGDWRKLAASLENKGQRHRLHLWRSREKRCLAENGEFLKVRSRDLSGFARRDRWTAELQRVLDEAPVSLFHSETRSVNGAVASGFLSLSERRFRVQKYRPAGFAVLMDVFGSRARRAWVTANSLRVRGIEGALPIACLERLRFRVPSESYLITEEVEGKRFSELLGNPGPAGFANKRSLIWSAARLLRRMHAGGVCGVDLKDSTLLVQNKNGGKFRLCVGAAGGARLGRVSRRRQVRDVGKLGQESAHHAAITRADRLRFLKAYLGFRKCAQWKEFWRASARAGAHASGPSRRVK